MWSNDFYNDWFTVTPSDTVDIVPRHFALVMGSAGVIALVNGRNQATNVTVVAGQLLPVQVRRVNATNTTVTSVVALNHI